MDSEKIITEEKESKKNFKYSEGYIQGVLNHFFAVNTIKYNIENLYVFGWESDKLLQTRSGYYYEFEIKISKSDFKNDFKNKKDKHIILEGEEKYGDKYLPKYYEFLEENKKRGEWAEASFHRWADDDPRYLVGKHKRPNYFYYAVPWEMLQAEDVPSYAGLVWVDENGRIATVKKAPKLHGDKIEDKELGLGEKFYYNMDYWRERYKSLLRNYNKKCDELKKEVSQNGHEKSYEEMETFYNYYKEKQEENEKHLADVEKNMRINGSIARRLRAKIKELDPDFDYEALEEEICGWYK